MNYSYEKLPLIDLSAPKVLGHSNRRGNNTSDEIIAQNLEDAGKILALADFDIDVCTGNTIGPDEKYMVEIRLDSASTVQNEKPIVDMIKKGLRKPHYTRLLICQDKLVFQAACCLPLRVTAAGLDGNVVSGSVLFNSHSEEDGGKLIYEFPDKGTEMAIELKRGESKRAQHLIFAITTKTQVKKVEA